MEVAARIAAHGAACAFCHRFQQSQERFLAAVASVRRRPLAPERLHQSVRAALAAQ
jgi:hypothetical protein